jgi:acyl-CoA thioester hydrolase
MTVESQWIDYNGHLNMAYYNVLFDRCVDEAFAEMGLGPQYLEKTGASFFTLQAQVNYLRELHEGDRVRCSLLIIDADDKRVHCFQELVHADEAYLAATSETMSMHIDMAARKSAPFPPAVMARIEAVKAAHADVPRPPQLGAAIAIRRKNG